MSSKDRFFAVLTPVVVALVAGFVVALVYGVMSSPELSAMRPGASLAIGAAVGFAYANPKVWLPKGALILTTAAWGGLGWGLYGLLFA